MMFRGNGSRDEFGIDNVQLYAGPPVVPTELRFMNFPYSFGSRPKLRIRNMRY